MTSKAQQIELDNALVTPENRRVIGKCNMRINPGMKPKEPTYQVALDALALTTCYPAFLITAEVSYILNICPRISGQEFNEPPTEEEALSFIRELGHSGEIKYITDVIGMYYKKNMDFVALIWEDLAYQIDNIDSKIQDKMFYPRFTKIIIHHFLEKDKHADTQVYSAILPKAMTNQALLEFVAYKTYFSIASGAEPSKSRKSLKKSDSAISFEESPSKNKGKGLNVLSEVALSEAAQLKEATKRSKKEFHASHASGSGDGTDFESRVPDEQHRKTASVDEGTGTKPGVPNVPEYDSESDKESWGDSEEEDDDEDDTKRNDDYDDDDDDDDDNDANDDDNQEDDDTSDDDEETDSDRTKSDKIKIPVVKQSSTEYYEEEEEEEKIDDEKKIDEEEDDEVTKELYNDVNVNLGNRDADMTDADQGGADQQNVSQESGFEQVEEDTHLLNLENPSLADNEISSLMDTTARHEEPRSQTSYLYTIPYAQALSSIPAILDRYIDNKLEEAIQKAILAHNLDCREEAQVEKRDYIELVDTSMRVILKEEVNTQLPQILPQAVSDFATHVIEKNVTKSLEATVLARSSSQPNSTYEAAALLSEFELTKILIDKTKKKKSYDKADYKRELYDALVKSYPTDKDLFDTYGEVFTLKRSRDDKDKDQDPFAGSDRGTKRRKSSKEAESSRDSRSKEKKSSSTSKDASHSQHKSSSKSVHEEEPSHTVDNSGVQQNQEFDTCNNDEQPTNKEVSKADWFKKPERPPTPDPDWNKRQHVDFRPPQAWISQVSHAKELTTSFDELINTTIDFSAYVRIGNIKDLTQAILVGLAFDLLKAPAIVLQN
ncbi:hypothetical protein Tco_0813288 [Tanacetum coccineum]